MPRPSPRSPGRWLAAMVLAAPLAAGAQTAALDVGTDSGTAGSTVAIPIALATDQQIAALQLDLTYASAVVTPTGVTLGGSATDHLIDSRVVSAGLFRVVVYSPTNGDLLAGTLANVSFAINGGASPQTTPIGITAVVLSDADGEAIATTGLDPGAVTVLSGSTPTDLAVSKSGFMNTQEQVFFTVTASNNGPNAATGATVADSLPAEIASATWTCTASGGATCPGGPLAGSLNANVNLPVGGQVVLQATATLAVPPGGSTTNTATITVPAGMNDTNPGNNTAQVTVPLVPFVIFQSGFETGNTSEWSSATGFTSLRLAFEPTAETPPGLLLAGIGDGKRELFRVEARSAGAGLEVRAVVRTTAGELKSSWQPLRTGNRVVLHWWASKPPSATNGGLRLWLGDALLVDHTGLASEGEVTYFETRGPTGQPVDPSIDLGVLAGFEILEQAR